MLDIKTLENWLWEAACSIRGAVDAPKYKDYILPLVFVKRLSDVFEDEINKLAKDYGNSDIAYKLVEKDHSLVRFFIPVESSWEVIRKHSKENLGEDLTTYLRTIAKENPKLSGVIDIVDYNATVSGERIISDIRLSKLIEAINKHRLGINDAEPDILGRAYEYLLRKFAEGQGQSAGEFYTPKEVGWIMAYILNPEQGNTVYDPACGSGGLLIKCELTLQESTKSRIERPLKLYGQEINPVTYAMAKMNMIIHDMEGEIAIGDTLRNPKFTKGGKLQTFDLVTANPMWNQDGYDSTFYESDEYNRFPYGFPTAQSADWGWVQLMLSSLNTNGRAAIILDTGAVSRGSGNKSTNREKDIRQKVIEADYIEGVLLLPDNLFYNTSAPGIIIFLNKNKPAERKNKVMVINASEEAKKSKESSKNFIEDESIKRIVGAFEAFKDVEKFAKVIDIEEIKKNDYNLSPSRYVQIGEVEELREIPEILEEIKKLKKKERNIDGKIKNVFQEIKLLPEDYEIVEISKKKYLEDIKGRLENDVKPYFDLIIQKKKENDEQNKNNPNYNPKENGWVGFWGLTRLIFPVIAALSNIDNTSGEGDPDIARFLMKHLKIQSPRIVLNMLRHPLIHGDKPLLIKYNNNQITCEIENGFDNNGVNNNMEHKFTKTNIRINMKILYDDLIKYLDNEIHSTNEKSIKTIKSLVVNNYSDENLISEVYALQND